MAHSVMTDGVALMIPPGEQVGAESLDSYEMLYLFRYSDRAWKVDEIRFTAPPQVGRKTTPWGADPRMLHGVTAPTRERK